MYERNFTARNSAYKLELTDFFRQTYQLVGASLLAATAGTYIGLSMLEVLTGFVKFGLIAVELILLFFVLPKVKHTPGLNMITLFIFTFLTGLTLAPLVGSILGMSAGVSILAQALLLTAVSFSGLSLFALTTKKDFSSLGKILFISLIVLLVGLISNIFIQNTMFQLIMAIAGSVLFSIMIVFDTQKIAKGAYETPIDAAISLYLNILNLFTFILQILGISNSDD